MFRVHRATANYDTMNPLFGERDFRWEHHRCLGDRLR
jgi:hypothetical protein